MSDTGNTIDWSDSGIYNTIKMIYRGDGCIQDGSCFERLASETDKWLIQRQQRAQQNNYMQTIIQNRYIPIFGQPTIRERECSKELESYYDILDKSVDNMGTNRDLFMRQGAEGGALFNREWCVIDDYSSADYENISLEQQKARRVFPFFRWVDSSCVDFEALKTDVFGNIVQFSFFYYVYDEDYGCNMRLRKTYTTEGIIISTLMYQSNVLKNKISEKGIERNRITKYDSFTPYPVDFYGLYGELPIYTLKYTDNLSAGEYKITPNTITIAKFAYSLFCRQSETEMTLAKNNMSLLVVPCERLSDVDVGNDNTLQAPVQGNMPAFLAPALEAIEKSYMMTEKDIESIFRQESLNYTTGTVSQSGLSKEMDNIATNNKLSFFAYELKMCDEWIDLWFARWIGKEKELKSTTAYYKLDYSPTDIEKQIKLLGFLMEVGGDEIEEVRKEVLNDLVMHAFPLRKKSMIDSLLKEIKSWVPVSFNKSDDMQ